MYSALIFLVMNLVSLLGIYFLFDDNLRIFIFLLWAGLFTFIYMYADRIILLHIGAREITDSDEKLFFQMLKSEVFQKCETMPKIYLYSGIDKRCFVLSSRHEWSIVISRDIFKEFSGGQLRSLINYSLNLKKKNACWLQTKGMGLIATILNFVLYIVNLISFSGRFKTLQYLLSLSLFVLTLPFLNLIFWITKNRLKTDLEVDILPIYHQVFGINKSQNFTEILTLGIIDKSERRNLIIKAMDLFPFLNQRNNELGIL